MSTIDSTSPEADRRLANRVPRSPKSAVGRRRAAIRESMPRLIAGLLVVAAIYSLIGLFARNSSLYDWGSVVFAMLAIPAGPSAFVAALLLVLAGPVRRRFRAAHTVLAVIMTTNVIFNSVDIALTVAWGDSTAGQTTLAAVTAVLNLVATGVVLWSGPAFTVRMTGRAVVRAAVVLVCGLLLAFAASFALISMLRPVGALERAKFSLATILGETDPSIVQVGPHWLAVLGGVLSAMAVVASLLVLWRAEHDSAQLGAADELAVRQLVLDHGEDDSLAYFATRRDKKVVFSPNGRAAVAFRPRATCRWPAATRSVTRPPGRRQ